MYGPDHYLSKIDRNANVLPNAPEAIKAECLEHIKWARELASRLGQLDYDVRDAAIDHIIEVMDQDYVKMGYELPKKPSMGK